MTRFFKPKFILKTGVGAFSSSYASLKALKKNKIINYKIIQNNNSFVGLIFPKIKN
jgi:hypothetical protein